MVGRCIRLLPYVTVHRRTTSIMSVFDERNFESKTADQLAQFYILGQTALHTFQSHFDPSTLRNHQARLPLYTLAKQTWRANPDVNPVDHPTYPLTSEKVTLYYEKCKKILENVGGESTLIQCVHLNIF